ncbi:ABC transporter substrate-binding protein [Aggregicoccus sp. 17bor-14]|uniref:ABC transporter substrate-binding protein n=1 Tax=Myxococcaceae TaxID=31 RepID=UPI00129C471B|nr:MULTISPECIES: ABC transporter substrate-binding protein [Myxococcaceae]MBF5045818.1 ABC transporter substrate-binding protein [Simulacricoccus sp. 17bor-14]MRI91553.1 ABC transporter substrate-binding protein [Aggregicoccus sp. 17bor-14]
MSPLRLLRLVPLALLLLLPSSCKKGGASAPGSPLRLGLFPNITHAQAMVGHVEGEFARALGETKLEVKQFNAGPAAMEALSAGSLDVSYVGPGPAINTFLKGGRQLRVIAGAVSGGAVLVTRTAKGPQELKGKRVATPQLGNTQDIALRAWLGKQGIAIAPSGETRPDAVSVTPLANPDILAQFQRGELEGAWVPEPWGARLVAEGQGKILLDERTLWPNGRFPTTLLVTTASVLQSRRAELKALLRAHLSLSGRWETDPKNFARAVNTAFAQLAGKPLPDATLQDAFSRLEPSLDPLPQALAKDAADAHALGFLPGEDLQGMVDTSLLDEVRAAKP